MKKEEKEYLINLKEKDGKSSNQIKLELERDNQYQQKLKILKRKKKKKKLEKEGKDNQLNRKFKEAFKKLK